MHAEQSSLAKAALATKAQASASDPQVSVFVDASAGSGKTKLLTDRLLRLMLPRPDPLKSGAFIAGARPETILCLTYTKAAAAEMQNRLREKLAQWFGLSDAALDQDFETLALPAGQPALREAARDLLRKVLESPIGVRIETIHAFCELLLRRFPAEAMIDPNFSLMEEREQKNILRQGVERGLADHWPAVAFLAPRWNLTPQAGTDTMALMSRVAQLNKRRDKMAFAAPLLAGQDSYKVFKRLYFQALDLSEEDEDCAQQWLIVPQEAEWVAVFEKIIGLKPERAEIYAFLRSSPSQREAGVWDSFFFTKEKERKKTILTKPELKAAPEAEALIEAEVARLQGLREKQKRVELALFGASFLTLGWEGLSTLEQRKRFTGQMDYDDLILQTRQLLQSAQADWVRYKLDGGIDHLLLDEVQDNSEVQWHIIQAVTSDFFAQQSEAENKHRTIFAVGDYKQSIFGFQGAAPKVFARQRENYAQKVKDSGAKWAEDISLNVSFRSTKPVLDFVNRLFGSGTGADGVSEASRAFPEHLSAKEDKGELWGRVDIWPAVQVPPLAPDPDDPSKRGETSETLLTRRLCDFLQKHFTGALQPKLEPRDVLFLVRKRADLPAGLMRQLKKKNINLVNCMGSPLLDTPQLQDMMILCEALLLPRDDYAFACFLTSPLGGLSSDGLMTLRLKGAKGDRRLGLWENLKKHHQEREDWGQAYRIFSALLSRVDFDTPYQILSEALGTQGGRARMIARFGREAEEPLDRLLEAALEYEALYPPSLQGFAAWMTENDSNIQRQAGEGENAVRFMTVFGAKGLQAPLVILLCKKGDGSKEDGFYWMAGAEAENVSLPVQKNWIKSLPDALAPEESQRKIAAEEELNRLLYVAVTRPENWLMVCGWGNAGEARFQQPEWIEKCTEALEKMGKQADGELVQTDLPPESLPQNAKSDPVLSYRAKGAVPAFLGGKALPPRAAPEMPAWVGQERGWKAVPAPSEDRLSRPLRPSRSQDGALEALPASVSPLAPKMAGQTKREKAAQRGIILHALLEFLPHIAPEARFETALNWLARQMPAQESQAQAQLARKITALLAEKELAPLFAPGSVAEQAVSGIVGDQVVNGVIDRVNVTARGIYLADYKTGRKKTGEGARAYQLQLALYGALLKQMHPDLPLFSFLIWTDSQDFTFFEADFLSQTLSDWQAGQKAKKSLPRQAL